MAVITYHKPPTNQSIDDGDQKILKLVYPTHVHSNTYHTELDLDSLFILVGNTLGHSTNIVDTTVQGSKVGYVTLHDNVPNFNPPLCILEQISSEMSCKVPTSAEETTLNILKKVSNYDWDAKVVLTIAAFALEYGEFWLLYQLQSTNSLAKSLAFLKRVPILTSPASLEKHRQAIIEVNNLVKKVLRVIEFLFQLEKLTTHDILDVPALAPLMEQLPVYVYWSIITIAAIVSQIHCLTTDSEHKLDHLSYYGQKINVICSKLEEQIELCRQQIKEVEYLRRIRKAFLTPTEIVEAIKILLFNFNEQTLFDGATKTTVDIDALRQKDVILLISTLDITQEEISMFNSLYNSIKTNEQYKVVWIPIVLLEEWNDLLRKKFEGLKRQVPWYVVQNFHTTVGHKFIAEDWHFQKNPIVVVLSPQSKVQHPNAFHLIQAYGMEAFPFTISKQIELNNQINWVGSVFANIIHPNINTWIKEEKFIFFYGGKDEDWIKQFTNHANDLANDAIIKEAKISIELLCVERQDKIFINRFWNGIESLFLTKDHIIVDNVTLKQVKRMLSYKSSTTGWAFLTKGSSMVVSGHGTTISKVVVEFGKWKQLVIKNGFDVSFQQHHDEILKNIHHQCSLLQISNAVGAMLPQTIECPECLKTMEIYFSYKCCHNDKTMVNGKL